MKGTDIRERKIYTEQSKTGMKIAIDINNGLSGVNRSISDVLDQLRELSNDSDRVVPALSSNQITVAFTRARERTGLEWKGSAPTFHEIRSLSACLYTDEKGAEFAQRILGHKSAPMTERYIDSRGSEWTSV